jgi:hypothetical protein
MKTKKLFLYLPVLTLFVRLWMIFILPKIGNFTPLYKFDHSRYHHFEIGIGFLVSALLIDQIDRFKKYTLLFCAVGGALVLDEYSFILRIFGFRLPYRYLSGVDTFVLMVIIVGLFLLYFSKKKTGRKRRK